MGRRAQRRGRKPPEERNHVHLTRRISKYLGYTAGEVARVSVGESIRGDPSVIVKANL